MTAGQSCLRRCLQSTLMHTPGPWRLLLTRLTHFSPPRQAHFSRVALSGDMAADQRTVVAEAIRLLQVMTVAVAGRRLALLAPSILCCSQQPCVICVALHVCTCFVGG